MKKGILLIVEDEADLSEILIEMLAPCCAEIYSVPNGKEALMILQQNEGIHAVLSDINMPQMTGFQLLAQLRGEGNNIPFVALTAYGDQENMRESIRLNVTDFLAKPFDSKELIDVINKVLRYGMELESMQKNISEIFNEYKISPEKITAIDACNRSSVMARIENSKHAKSLVLKSK